jgi:DNA ligase-1
LKAFSRLYAALDETTRTNAKVDAMAEYFRSVAPADAAWAVYFLTGNRPKRLIGVRKLAAWAMELADVPDWLFSECYDAVGDLAETIALLLPPADGSAALSLAQWVEGRLLVLSEMDEAGQRDAVRVAWRQLDGMERFVWNKLATGELRVGVSESLVLRALSKASGIGEDVLAHRISGNWQPTAASFSALVANDTQDAEVSRPYPFFLAYPIEGSVDALGEAAAWRAEWKWDGIRAQVIRREGNAFIWTRGGELATDRFPEVAGAAAQLPNGTVLDGELMPWKEGRPLPFSQLQRRVGRKKLSPTILTEVPVVLIAYDLLELGGRDLREEPLSSRRSMLERLVQTTASPSLIISQAVPLSTWSDARAAFERSREMRAEGLMLKHGESVYGTGRRKGSWWKWKLEPFHVDAVMIYAQPGHGRRASLHSDYTFGIWDGDVLVPFAKAYSGLTDAEIRELDAWIRRNTLEKFGPVRHVAPEQVFELGFEGIQKSTRHKSGVAVRFPRMLRWRKDKPAAEADSIDTLRALMEDGS